MNISFMIRILQLAFFLMMPFVLTAQFTDNFGDGDFTYNPTWSGHDAKFQVSPDNRLWLNEAEFTGDAYLSTPSQAVLDASWEFVVQYDFNPSSSNYTEVYLMSSQADLSASLNGYYVRVGYTDDDICLFRKTGTAATRIIDGTNGRLNTATVNVRIKVTRDETGNWSLYSDTLGGFDYQTEGSVFDNSHATSSFFGVRCIYSTTRKDKIYFDDFVVSGNFVTDTEAPVLLSAVVVPPNKLKLIFDEALLETAVLNTENYDASQGLGQPETVGFFEANPSQLLLSFTSEIVSGENYLLQYQNIEDMAGNIMPAASVSFSWVATAQNLIVINEIMADPSPVVGLPEAEYIEIFNTSQATVDLSGWMLIVGNYVRSFPTVQIAGESYMLLCHPDKAALFATDINIAAIPSFPAISNSGTTLKLLDADSVEVNTVTYSISWYGDGNKDDGGWSLEQIDPYNYCEASMNWTASNDESGGTPGYVNSVFASNPDLTPPSVVSVSAFAGNGIQVVFSEAVDTVSALNTDNYEISPEFGHPELAETDSDRKTIRLYVGSAFTENMVYTLSIGAIADVCGNVSSPSQFSFSVYTATIHNILITEIMADPDPVVGLPNAEYIELYNASNFPLDLDGWQIRVNSSYCNLPAYTLDPGAYVALCNGNNLNFFSGMQGIVGVTGLPALTNAGATVSLLSREGNYIHAVSYSDAWYRNNFKKEGGWSLEMIDLTNPCEGSNNWSASVHVSGGTPAAENSVAATNSDIQSPLVQYAEITLADTVRVYFSEAMSIDALLQSENYWVDRSIGHPVWVYAEPPLYESVLLKFDTVFEQGLIYTLEFSDSIVDCAGNNLVNYHEVIFGIADSVAPGDLVINEVLFNPYPGGYDFVEFYNRSEKLLDLKQLWLSKRNAEGSPDAAKQASAYSVLIPPQHYMVVTENASDIGSRYYVPYPDKIIQSAALPSLPDNEGNLVVFNRSMIVIDEFSYSEDMHFALLSSNDGVSLERIDYDAPSQDATNWHSAAGSEGYATPGYQNSQFRPSDTEIIGSITVDPKVFSPDNDGFDDRLNIVLSFENPGTVANIAVYDAKGRFIVWLAQNTSLPLMGTLTWDGLDSRNQLCPIGIYIIYAELYDVSGKTWHEKIACVLSLMK